MHGKRHCQEQYCTQVATPCTLFSTLHGPRAKRITVLNWHPPLLFLRCRALMPSAAGPIARRRDRVPLPDSNQHGEAAPQRPAAGYNSAARSLLGTDVQHCTWRVHPGVSRGRPCAAPGPGGVLQCHGLLQSRCCWRTEDAADLLMTLIGVSAV